MRYKFLFLSALMLIPGVANADTTSVDNTFVANDVFASDFHTRLNRNFTQLQNGANNVTGTVTGSVQASGQVGADTLGEANMADEINPRIRTAEGASCEFTYTGLQPATDSDLTSDISAGTAYPEGYRIRKDSATANTYTANKDTYVDIDINGDFQFSEVANDATAPSIAANSVRLAKVVTDGTTISSVEDLRTTSCTNGPFEEIADTTNEATLEDILANGSPIVSSDSWGWVQGAHIKWLNGTQFAVTSGSAYIAGSYRASSTQTIVGTGNDDPSAGGSGLDTSSITADQTYYVYLVADEAEKSTYSVTYSTSDGSPSGLTKFRKIGTINTDGSTFFVSRDVYTIHSDDLEVVIVSYAGAAGDNRNITVGFRDTNRVPQWARINPGNNAYNGYERFDTLDKSDSSMNYMAASGPATDQIQTFSANVVQIGDANDVNAAGIDYHMIVVG